MNAIRTYKYIARDGRYYSHKETPSEYRDRRHLWGGGGDPDDGCGCLILAVIIWFIFF